MNTGFEDVATTVVAILGALAVPVSLWQYLKSSHDAKLVFTLQRCNSLSRALRTPHVHSFLGKIDASESKSSYEMARILREDVSEDERTAIAQYVDDLEMFGVLYNKRAMHRHFVHSEIGEQLLYTYATMKPLIIYQVELDSTTMWYNYLKMMLRVKRHAAKLKPTPKRWLK